MDASLFDRASAAVSCEDVAERGGRTVLRKGRGVCPLNGCGANSKAQPFAVLDSGRRWKCWSCDPKGGDVVDLEHRLYSSGSDTLADAARRLVGGVAQEESAESRERRSKARAQAEEEAMADAAWKTELARSLWREAGAALGSPAQTYLEARAIRGPVAARALALLRFHPAAYHSGDPTHGVRLPAMIGLIMTEFGPTGGVHVTYLSPDGKRKTHRDPAKRMWGPQGVRVAVGDDTMSVPGGIWLTRPDAPGPLVVAEGIENALSRAMLLAGDLSLPVRAAAAGSLDRLAGFEVTDPKTGARDVWSVTPDPLRPPFTWPEDPAHPFGLVEVATDGDMSPVKVKGWAGKKKTKLTTFERHSAERARVCGALGVAGWRRRLAPDSGTVVKATRSPLGLDFNDVLKATASGETGAMA
ncbi:DUF7146 domain-containing protein [Brevundimonas subvibrioides]|uniref:DUF7146 domain-containing protein n=1 Tax=Brevundimonas subvibrioides (strain ATCC 15264 / DSM 4735 / LMG 14903 / NBRC 16000 / CB 81) TaxID=633149 RepID=D9QFX1_BRESC|nr:hypothetical protein [Brevundimonas subvibrioides]ADL00685.1 hypothetical protein Bresu_1373 [Brevundimonas subvibrioides ATCC 15264]